MAKDLNALFRLIAITLFSVIAMASCAHRNHSTPTGAVDPAMTGKKHVRVSLNNRAVYVYDEKGEPVFVEAVAIGTPSDPTPKGDFKAFNKIAQKRSGSYGFFVKGNEIKPGKRTNMPSGYRYVGYPMPYWVEFQSGYGFHAGAVWPTPRSHGCLRIHKTKAAEFFALVDEETPIHIADALPEDKMHYGKKIWRPTDYALPNSPGPVLISNAPFVSHNVVF